MMSSFATWLPQLYQSHAHCNMAFTGPQGNYQEFNYDLHLPSLTSPPSVESLELSELLKNEHVRKLFTKYQEATTQVVQASEMQKTLWKENMRLNSELQSTAAELQSLKSSGFWYVFILPFSVLYSTFFSLRPQFSGSPAASITPSDSISQQASSPSHPPPQPLLRPSHYPAEILWTFEDCRSDPMVDVTEFNKSRPAMDRAIRHENGTMISLSEWNAIKGSARMIRYELQKLPVSDRRGAPKKRRGKVYYRSHHPKEWAEAIAKLERLQPLLMLCTSNWKANQVLGNALLAVPNGTTDDSSNESSVPSGAESSPRRNKGKGKKKKRNREMGKNKKNAHESDHQSVAMSEWLS